MKQLFINQALAGSEHAKLIDTAKKVDNIRIYLTEKNYLCTDFSIKEVSIGQHQSVLDAYLLKENEKMAAFIAQFGDIGSINADHQTKLVERVQALRNELDSYCPAIAPDCKQYINMLVISPDAVTIDEVYDIKYFENLYSVQADEKQFKKHCDFVDWLNEIKGDTENEYTLLNSLMYFNLETKQFEANIEYYDTQNIRG